MSAGPGIMRAVVGAAQVLAVACSASAGGYRDADPRVALDRSGRPEVQRPVFGERPDLGAALIGVSSTGPEAPRETGSATEDADGNPDRGAQVFRKCQSCHAVGPDARDRVGPHLNDIFGRQAGVHAGFRYSDDMAKMGADGLRWTADALDAYLEDPRALVPRTRMAFAGLRDPQDRADVLAFLRRYSAGPAPASDVASTGAAPEVDLPPETLSIVGDPEYGEYLASDCATCHQRSGADEGIPAITGWPVEDFVIAMHAYKQKIRPHPVMQMMAGRLSDDEIAALAAYFRTLD